MIHLAYKTPHGSWRPAGGIGVESFEPAPEPAEMKKLPTIRAMFIDDAGPAREATIYMIDDQTAWVDDD